MRLRTTTVQILAYVLFASIATPALAQGDEPARPSYSRMLNIDALIDNHVRFLARRYNLSEDQEAYTQAFVRQKADAFLQKHREELYDLVDRLFEVRAGGNMDTQELAKWGTRALPLYEEAKALIVDGNNEWREILTDDQRKTHDEDVREMYDSFSTTEDQLHRIVSGQMTLEEFRKGPGRQTPRPATTPPTKNAPQAPVARETPPAVRETPAAARETPAEPSAKTSGGSVVPAAPAAPAAPVDRPHVTLEANGRATSKPAARPAENAGPRQAQRARDRGAARTQPTPAAPTSTEFESQWETYVREFIQRYQLDDAQTQKAQSILKDCQDLGQRQMQKRKPEIERLEKKLATLPESKDKLKEMTEINQQRAKLLEPITEIFEKQLKPRLDKLPTRAQRQTAEQGGRPNQPAPGKPGRTQPSPARPSTQPQPVQPQPTPAPQPVPQTPPQPTPQPPPQPEPEPQPVPQPEPEPPPPQPESPEAMPAT